MTPAEISLVLNEALLWQRADPDKRDIIVSSIDNRAALSLFVGYEEQFYTPEEATAWALHQYETRMKKIIAEAVK